jgi:hypothetical protein
MVKYLFKVIMQARHIKSVHINGAKIGMRYINTVMFRPFIQMITGSMIVMRRGYDCASTVISRPTADTSKQDRGIYTLNFGIYTGVVRQDLDGVWILHHVHPVEFIGGKNTSFMTNPGQFNSRSVDKPSILCFATSITELTYGIFHMTNSFDFELKSDTTRTCFRKWSGASFYQSVYGADNTKIVDITQATTRNKFGKTCIASHVAYRGPVYYVDPRTLKIIDKEGTGPTGERRANMKGAEKTYMGLVPTFPVDIPLIQTQQRAG